MIALSVAAVVAVCAPRCYRLGHRALVGRLSYCSTYLVSWISCSVATALSRPPRLRIRPNRRLPVYRRLLLGLLHRICRAQPVVVTVRRSSILFHSIYASAFYTRYTLCHALYRLPRIFRVPLTLRHRYRCYLHLPRFVRIVLLMQTHSFFLFWLVVLMRKYLLLCKPSYTYALPLNFSFTPARYVYREYLFRARTLH
ncbi:unnamed protein product [Ceratitis capitata]|uniref:(Mediterranean fruit fly) hypothetical protein n=1 Tax=Ceratitis capitata TaxID=7213 RepID=A0A811UV82_CERCA|nr:unnamed protein product [Ceratitis capitata]